MPNIYLLGFMGSGKSTVGPMLARLLGRPFYDLDQLIEKDRRMTISEIFETRGETYFREVETRLLLESESLAPYVMALGGGTFVSAANRDFVARHGTSVWLKIDLEVAHQRCHSKSDRPLARDPERFKALLDFRRQFYQSADLHVDTENKSPDQISLEIQKALIKKSDFRI
ncbi:MAG: shikimate kinase [Acidobacteriota bacterium]